METKEEICLKLYIIGCSNASNEMIIKLTTLLDANIKNYTLEIIDILKNPEQTIAANILASPTLIKVKPFPEKRIIGNFPFNSLIKELNLPNLENSY